MRRSPPPRWPSLARTRRMSRRRRGSASRLGLVDVDQQIEVARRVAELGQRRGDLTAMLGGVIHLVDHLLPQRVGPALAVGVLVLDDAREIGVGQAADEALRLG